MLYTTPLLKEISTVKKWPWKYMSIIMLKTNVWSSNLKKKRLKKSFLITLFLIFFLHIVIRLTNNNIYQKIINRWSLYCYIYGVNDFSFNILNVQCVIVSFIDVNKSGKKTSMNSLNMLNDLTYKYDCLMINAITQSTTSSYNYFKWTSFTKLYK